MNAVPDLPTETEPEYRLEVADGMVQRMHGLIDPVAREQELDLVRIQISGGQRKVMQIMAEPLDKTQGMGINECTRLSRELSAIFDVEEPMTSAYVLEISSPGIDRPLTRFDDFVRYVGFEAKVETRLPVSGRRRFRGVLTIASMDDRSIHLENDAESAILAFDDLAKAKLILTDALIDAHQDGLFVGHSSDAIADQTDPNSAEGQA